jgi:neuroligin
LRKLASSHYQSYTTALTVTIAVGCFLLLLNILIFAGIYHQRDRRHHDKKKRKEEEESTSDNKTPLQHQEVELEEMKGSPSMGGCMYPQAGGCYSGDQVLQSPSIPEPPPPPKHGPPSSSCNSSGILRQSPQTPASMKKRVQIQEISV